MPLIFVLPVLPGLYLGWKALRLPLPIVVRVLLTLLSLGVSQIYPIQHRLFGSLAGPNVQAWVLELQVWAFAGLVLIFLATLVWDLGRLILRLRRLAFTSGKKEGKKPGQAGQVKGPARERGPAAARDAGADLACDTPRAPTRRDFLKQGASLAGAGFVVPAGGAMSAWGVTEAVAVPTIMSWTLQSPVLPDELDGLTIAHMADLHFGPLSRRERVTELVEHINDLKPDLVCLTGDLVDGDPSWRCASASPRGELAKELGKLASRHGTFACTGNHEYYASYSSWMRLWTEANIRFLHNEHALLPIKNGAWLALGGLDDRVGGTRHRAAQVFAGMDIEAGRCFKILLDHRPGDAARNRELGAQLQLSGHTHGGQCPLLDRVIANANGGFVRHWYDVDSMPLYVTAGAALWPGFAMRLGVPAEAAFIRLAKGSRLSFAKTGEA